MKRRVLIFFLAIGVTVMSSVSMAAMNNNRIRKETHFPTDKIAYELNLSTGQYNDAYEIDYDFVYSIRYLMGDVMRGEKWALDKYYRTLDVRNDDLRRVLTASQYRRFIGMDYFYRPIYANGGGWSFRIYIRCTNYNHFYLEKPYHYSSYCGEHYRTHYHSSYYHGRYRHDFCSGSHSIRGHRNYSTHRRPDFSTVAIRPNSARRDDVWKNDVRRENSVSRDKNGVTPRSSATPNRVTPERTDSRHSSSRSQERVENNNSTRNSISEHSSSSRRSSGNSSSGSNRSSSSRSSERGSRDK